MDQELIFVALPDEAVQVWRPVRAIRLGSDSFRIAEQPYDAAIERWQFEPGDTVYCEEVASADGVILAAVRSA